MVLSSLGLGQAPSGVPESTKVQVAKSLTSNKRASFQQRRSETPWPQGHEKPGRAAGGKSGPTCLHNLLESELSLVNCQHYLRR